MGFTEEIADMGMLTPPVWPQGLSQGSSFNIKQKDKRFPDEVMLAKTFTLKELQEILCNIESTKDKMLEAAPNLEEYENLPMLHKCMLHNKMKGETVCSS